MQRSFNPEILDGADVPEESAARVHRDITAIHRLLGDTRCIVQALRRDPLPVRRVLDVGCGYGGTLEEVTRALGIPGIGVDITTPSRGRSSTEQPIIRADAVRDLLPVADAAFSLHTAHHLSESELVQMIRNVGRFCRRFIMLDLVRAPLPLALFKIFIAPFVSRIAASDGQTSVRRAYTPAELNRLVSEALAGTGASFRHSVSPFSLRQIVDISYPPPQADNLDRGRWQDTSPATSQPDPSKSVPFAEPA
jgi:SAM-dependent methyltransferase